MGARASFIITGIVAWLGGLATAFAVSSCDTDTCAMDPDDPSCVPYYPHSGAGKASLTSIPPSSCDRMSRPSVYVVASRRVGDMVRVVDVDMVWYEHDGQTYEARCVQGDGGCTAWLAGNELEGTILVSTEHCDTVVTASVEVGRTEDDCHVETEFVVLDVSTLGCLTDRPDEPPPKQLAAPG